MSNKNSYTTGHSSSKRRKAWLFGFYVISLLLVAVLGAFFERYLGYSSTLIKKNQLEQSQSTQVNQNSEVLSKSLEELVEQTAALKVKTEQLERVSKYIVDNLPESSQKPSSTELLPLLEKNKAPMGEEEKEKSGESAEEIGRHIDELRNKVSYQNDKLQIIKVLLRDDITNYNKAPTGMPVASTARLSSPFGYRIHPIKGTYTMHTGTDFAIAYGSPIYSSSAGIVDFVGYKTGYGYTIDINHGAGVVTRYAHASKMFVKKGDLVRKHQKIALVGTTGYATGPHIHFEVRIDDVPVNPMLFLGKDMFSLVGKTDGNFMKEVGLLGRAKTQ